MKYNLVELDISGKSPVYSIKYDNQERYPGPCPVIGAYPRYAKYVPHGEEDVAKKELAHHAMTCIKNDLEKINQIYEHVQSCLKDCIT